MKVGFAAAAFACMCCVAVLVWSCQSKQRWNEKAISKSLASVSFIAAGFFNWRESVGEARTYGTWIMGGLLFSMGGDVALLFEGKNPFLVGLVLFLVAHLFYLRAFWGAQMDFHNAVPHILWVVPFLASIGWMLLISGPPADQLVPSGMKIPVGVYLVVIAFMVISSFGYKASKWACIGAVLFMLSDLCVANRSFGLVSKSGKNWPYNEFIGLPLYNVAQIIIALSIDRAGKEKVSID